MSFIVDALKKSEDARLRQVGVMTPTVGGSSSQSRMPHWALGLVLLLAVNLLVLVYVLLRPSAETSEQQTPVASDALSDSAPLAAVAATVANPTAVATRAAEPLAPAAVSTVSASPLASDRSSIDRQPSAPSRDSLLALGQALPEANVNLHVFDNDPSRRFVLLNGQRLREGERSTNGLQVVRITPEGVLLNHLDATFMVTIAAP